MRLRLALLAWISFLIPALQVGCSSATTTSSDLTGKGSLTELAAMLKDIGSQNKKMPGKLSEMEPYDPAYPVAYSAIARGEIVYIWGQGLGNGSAVIAYEKKVPAEGGWVLLQDETVKEMTAADFGSAEKAKK